MGKQSTAAQKTATAEKEKKTGQKNTTDGDESKRARAEWRVWQEFDLLQIYKEAPKATTAGKCLTKAGWNSLTSSLNDKYERMFTKGQYNKSKVDRILQDYDVYEEVKSKSGVGIDQKRGKLSFPRQSFERAGGI
ncbi:Hypothetical protein PHPALM_18003 [Phytophthora palmivora]|uniref:Myb/SANT-like domain-containing protein n=1 Tax=Phytophthora palmivora TaxID=4796 RepID=A0A2P4XL07_9STRA|nr:Hypothetical protein PHPALM_18003 [Phytophthora palmivora]